MHQARPESRTTSFRDQLAVARRRKWIIVVATVLLPALAVALSLRQTPEYGASAEVLVSRQNPAAALLGTQQSSLLADRDAETEASLARVPAVLERTLASQRVRDLTIQDFLEKSSVSAAVNSDLLTFEVTLPDRERAQHLATAYADQYTLYRRQLDTTALKQARTAIERRLAQLESSNGRQPPGDAQLDTVGRSALYANLIEKDEQLRTAEALSLSKFVLVKPADEATKVRPRPVKNGLLGLVLGIMLGIGLAFFKENMDTRPRSGIELGAELGVPLLARIPSGSHRLHRENRLVMFAEPQAAAAEAFRILRANLELLDGRGGGYRRIVMVTSAADGEGKSTTVANLGIAFAQAGRRVTLVDLDLRRPSLAKFFGIQGQPGLVDVTSGHVPAAEALVDIPIGSRKNGYSGSPSGHGNGNGNGRSQVGARLSILVAGSVSVEPGDFVGSAALASTLEDLRRRSDIVLVDAPPLLGVGDALMLSSKVDDLIIVSRLGRIGQPVINELRTVLQACPARKVGVVLTGVDPKRLYGDPAAFRGEVGDLEQPQRVA